MNNYNNKFKDRSPEETIKIIQSFFTERGYVIKEYVSEREIGCWAGTFYLYLDDQFILMQGGKGISEIYCRASGLAEVYERFCNKMPYAFNCVTHNKIMDNNFSKYNYYLDKNEIKTSFENYMENNSLIRESFLQAFNNNVSNIKEYFSLLCYRGILGIPFDGFTTNDKKYYDIRTTYILTGSTGLSAGNTYEEAVVQGISEWYERYGVEKFYKELQDKYYFIDINNFSKKNQEMYYKLEALGCHSYILDLSYNFGIPIICLVSVKDHNTLNHFGVFPNADIALERCFTEMYQRITEIELGKNNPPTMTQKTSNWEKELFNFNSYTSLTYIPDLLFTKDIINSKINNQVFLDSNKNYSSKELFNYYKELSQNLKLNFYIRDNSLSSKIKAVYIFCDNALPLENLIKNLNNITTKEKEMFFQYYKTCHLLLNKLASKETKLSHDIIHQLIIQEKLWDNENLFTFIAFLARCDILIPYIPFSSPVNITRSLIQSFYNNNNNLFYIFKILKGSCYYNIFSQIFLITHYKIAGYNYNELKAIFKYLHKRDVSYEEYLNNNNSEFLFKMFVQLYNSILESKTYQIFIQSYYKEEEEENGIN